MVTIPKSPRRLIPLRNYSETEGACRCGCGERPTDDLMIRLQCFVLFLERETGCSVKHLTTSGSRCKTDNARVGGASDSRHLHNDAMDGTFQEFRGGQWRQIPNREVAHYAQRCGLFSGVGFLKYEKSGENCVHLDCRPGALVVW
jgi:uncharacterized protein YcbK (DUF882 family)